MEKRIWQSSKTVGECATCVRIITSGFSSTEEILSLVCATGHHHYGISVFVLFTDEATFGPMASLSCIIVICGLQTILTEWLKHLSTAVQHQCVGRDYWRPPTWTISASTTLERRNVSGLPPKHVTVLCNRPSLLWDFCLCPLHR